MRTSSLLSTFPITHRHRSHRLNALAAGLGVTVLALLGGCATKVPVYEASFDNVKVLTADALKPSAVDKFTGGPDSISVRGVNQGESPVGSNFADYIQDALSQELTKANLLVLSSDYHIQGKVVSTDIDAAMDTGHTTASVDFVVTRSGQPIFEKVISADYQWESSFVGAIAIPRGFQSYPKTVEMLLNNLYKDPDFVKSLK